MSIMILVMASGYDVMKVAKDREPQGSDIMFNYESLHVYRYWEEVQKQLHSYELSLYRIIEEQILLKLWLNITRTLGLQVLLGL